MENLSDYLKNLHENGLDFMVSSLDYYNNLSEFYNNDIPYDLINDFCNDIRRDYIGENLKTHNYKLLQSKLINKFDDIIDFNNQNGSDDKCSFIINSKNKDIVYNDEFIKIVEFFNYKIRNIFTTTNGLYAIIMEPVYSEDMTNIVYDKCNGIIYHITDDRNVDSILRNGLRIKKISSDMPGRVYVYAPGFYISNKNKELWGDFIKRIGKYGDYKILKINLHKLKTKLKFYKDTAMNGDEVLFTYNNIPKICIEEVKI